MSEKIKPSKYLKELRLKAGMSVPEAAVFLNIGQRMYYNLENGLYEPSAIEINKFEVRLGLINTKHECPNCGMRF